VVLPSDLKISLIYYCAKLIEYKFGKQYLPDITYPVIPRGHRLQQLRWRRQQPGKVHLISLKRPLSGPRQGGGAGGGAGGGGSASFRCI